MVISYKNRFIFLHNYKVAGTSVTEALRNHGLVDPFRNTLVNKMVESSRLTNIKTFNKVFLKVGKVLGYENIKHHNNAIKIKEKLPTAIWKSFYKFGFVRNPWDWQVSLYHYMMESKKHFQHDLIKKIESFEDYIEWRVKNDLHLQKEFFSDDE